MTDPQPASTSRPASSLPASANALPALDALESFKALAAQSLWSNEINSARANLLMTLSNLEQAQLLGRTVPACAAYDPALAEAIADTKHILSTIRFTDAPATPETLNPDSTDKP